ncbi:MAG: hypothetical protein ABL933_02440 [Methyloglobulus sp.]|nr:hypothetical protein [Methyloglobulus sp.]
MKLKDFVIAEDIRFENGNKISIMGVVDDEVTLTLPDDVEWPIPYRFGVFIRLNVEKTDLKPTKFTLTVVHDVNTIAKLDGSFEQKDTLGKIMLPLVINPFPLPGYGTIRFIIDIYNNENLLISESKELKVYPTKLEHN